jgi:RimJ/RimL family protein N-acetyltransferase
MIVLETERLALREATEEDDAFFLALLNDPDWIRYIGDRGVRTPDDARRYVSEKLTTSYRRHGFGLYVVVLKSTGAPTGICGLIRRETLEDVDVGFAMLPAYRGSGYALEATRAVLHHGRSAFALRRIVAITIPDNRGSIRVLEGAGMTFERVIRLPDDDDELALYAWNGDGDGDGDAAGYVFP